jgi:hypothetical protein
VVLSPAAGAAGGEGGCARERDHVQDGDDRHAAHGDEPCPAGTFSATAAQPRSRTGSDQDHAQADQHGGGSYAEG